MKIALFDATQEDKDYFKENLKDLKLSFFEEPFHKVDIKKIKDVELICTFIHSELKGEYLSELANLRAIVTRSTGTDHVDVEYCKKKGIEVLNVPFYGENTVAEHTFALILNLSRNIHKSYLRTINHNYSIEGLTGFDLKDKTLGVIGVGHIGLHVIRIAKGFGMHVKAHDLNHNVFLSEVLHFKYCELDELLKTCDIITLHMPYIKEVNHHFLDENKLKKTKKRVIIINTARGPLIDTKVLYDFLKSGHIGGAGLDVIEGEELIDEREELLENSGHNQKVFELYRDEQIFKMENVIFTPHNAFNSKEALQRILDTTRDNILGVTHQKS